jgi:exonuclease SbcC
MPTEEVLTILDELIRNDGEAEEVLAKESEELTASLQQITALLSKAEIWERARRSKESSAIALTEARTKLEILKDALTVEEEKKPQVEQITAQIARIDAEQTEYRELDEVKATVVRLETGLINHQRDLESRRKKIDTLTRTAEALKEERKGLENADATKTEWAAKKNQLSIRKITLQGIKTELDVLSKLRSKLELEQKTCSMALETSREAGQRYAKQFDLYISEQAGILAERLTEGSPCPVCGSITHPNPATKSEGAPTKEQLDELRTTAETAQKRAEAAASAASATRGKVEEKESSICASLVKELNHSTLENAPACVQSALTAVQSEITACDKAIEAQQGKIDRRIQIDEILPKNEKERENLEWDVRTVSDAIIRDTAKLKSLQERIKTLIEKLGYASEALSQQARKSFVREKNVLVQAYENASKAVTDQNTYIQGLIAAIAEAEKVLESAENVDVKAEAERKLAIITRQDCVSKQSKSIHARQNANRSAYEGITGNVEEITVIENKLAWVRALSDTANGSIKGKERIMLETYIQMTYFDRIIARANTRFMVMSGGQYELKRRKEAEDLRSQSGLELDVVDHYNGTERSVKTLSGGESFKASLSLALGLSDEIQSSAGGVRLVTMFVDEGFGSLDEESLNQAIRALLTLTEGNRLVGIISHVAELKERIDRQIVVTKEKSGGSLVKIV